MDSDSTSLREVILNRWTTETPSTEMLDFDGLYPRNLPRKVELGILIGELQELQKRLNEAQELEDSVEDYTD